MPRKHRKSQPPCTMTSITQWFRAALLVGKILLLQRAGCPPGQPFALFICRHCLLSFVHRLSGAASKPTPGRQVDFRQVGLQSVLSRGIRELAEYSGRGSDPLAVRAVGQVRSRDIRADRSFSLSVVDYIVSEGERSAYGRRCTVAFAAVIHARYRGRASHRFSPSGFFICRHSHLP